MVHNAIVTMKRSCSGLLVTWRDDHGGRVAADECIQSDLLHRSQHLLQVYDSLEDGEHHWLGTQGAWVSAWLDFVRQRDVVNSATPTARLATALQAADFLIDQVSVNALCDHLASRLLASSELHSSHGPTESEVFGLHHVLERLPESLLLSVLRAAVSIVFKDPNVSTLRSECTIGDVLPLLLMRLPRRLWPLAVTAAIPSVDTGSLALGDCSPDTACDVILTAPQLPALTSLTLECIIPRRDWQHSGDGDYFSDVIRAFCSLSSLLSLKLSHAVWLFPGGSTQGLCRVLPSLSQLTALNLHRPGFSPDGEVGDLWPQLRHLKSLRRLELSEAGLDYEAPTYEGQRFRRRFKGVDRRSQQQVEQQFLHFLEGLKHLCALEELALRHCGMGKTGWALLAPAAASLSLRSLVLQNCSLRKADELLFRDNGVPYAFASLERLALGDIFGSAHQCLESELPRCERLRHLEIGDCHKRLWVSLRDAPLRLETLKLLDAAPDDSAGDAAMSMVLARMTSLRRLELSVRKCNESWPSPLAEALPSLTALTCLHLFGCVLGAERHQWEQLAASFVQLTALEELHMESCRGELAAHAVVTGALATLTQLTHLVLRDLYELHSGFNWEDFSCYPISVDNDAFVDAFAGCLQPLRNLRVLQLYLVAVRAARAAALAASIAGMSQMQTLLIHGCDFGGDGGQSLARALRNMPKLREANLCGCGLVDNAAEVVTAALAKSVTKVDLRR